MAPSYRMAIEAAIILWLLFPLRGLHQTFFRWIGQHPLFAFEVGFLLVIEYGVIGSEYGLRELFWHDSAWVQVAAGLSVAALLLLLVALTCAIDGTGNATTTIAFLRDAQRERLPLGRRLNCRVTSWIEPGRMRTSTAYRLAVLYLSVLVPFAVLVAIPTIVWAPTSSRGEGRRVFPRCVFPSTFVIVATWVAAALTAWTDEPMRVSRGAPRASDATKATEEFPSGKRSFKDRTLGVLPSLLVALPFLGLFSIGAVTSLTPYPSGGFDSRVRCSCASGLSLPRP